MKILLDLDGVLVDFVGAACEVHGVSDPFSEPLASGAKGNWELDKLMGLSGNEFWSRFDHDFWAGVSFTPDGQDIRIAVEEAVGAENVCLLTSPTLSPEAASGKMEWIQNNLPDYSRRFLIGSAKQFCASRDSLLIDDADRNVKVFSDAGGNVILVPRPWNANWEDRHRAVDWVKWCLESVLGEEE